MKLIQKHIGVVAVIALVIAVIALFFPLRSGKIFGGVTNYDALTLDSGDLTITSGNLTLSSGKITSSGTLTSGGVLSTTTTASMTLKASDLAYSTISMVEGGVGGITVTLPATTTSGMSTFLPNAGDRTSIVIINASSTGAVSDTITIAGGTGSLLKQASSSPTANLIAPGIMGKLDVVRKANTDLLFLLTWGN